MPGSELARCEKERFCLPDCATSFRFLHRFSTGATAPRISTTTTIGIQSHEDALLAATTGIAATGADSVTVADAVLSFAGSVAASATGVLDGSPGVPAVAGVADGLGCSAGIWVR